MKLQSEVCFARTIALIGLYSLVPFTAHAQNTVYFSTSAAGVTKSIAQWGVEVVDGDPDYMRQSVENMGANNINLVAANFFVDQPLQANGQVATADQPAINFQLAYAAGAGYKPFVIGPNVGDTDSSYLNGSQVNVNQWAAVMEATKSYVYMPVVGAMPFNEPDYWSGQGTPQNLHDIMALLKSNSGFQGVSLIGASTLNSNNAQYWYNYISGVAQYGSTHVLGGSATSYEDFFQSVTASGGTASAPEIHELGEAIYAAEYGAQQGIWWGPASLVRGLFVQSSQGTQLGYAENTANDTAATVYRGQDGSIRAFAGGFERMGSPTAYRFVSTSGPVYFNGVGPISQYMIQVGQGSEAYADIQTGSNVMPALDGNRWEIVNRQTGQVLEVAGGGTADGALVNTALGSGASYQMWNIIRNQNGYYDLSNANSGLTLDINGGSIVDNGAVDQWGTGNSTIQQWYIQSAGNGYYNILNANSNRLLTGGTGNADAVQLGNTGSALQQWQFVLANPATSGTLTSQYKFQGNLNDSAGTNNGVAFGNPSYGSAPPGGQGQAIILNGSSNYAQLPSGVANSSAITISALVNWNGGNAWQRIFDFGSGTTSYMFLTPESGYNTLRFAITNSGGSGEQILDTNPLPTGQWVQVAVTISGDTGVLYENGQPIVAGQIPLNPSQISQTLNYIGKSQYSADPLFSGEIADFRIYNYALNQSQMANLVPLTWTGSLSSNWTGATLANPSNWQVVGTSAEYAGGDVVLFNDTAANFTVNVADATVVPGSILFSNSANNYLLTGPGALSGSSALSKNGAAALTINNANAYSGGTVLSGGTLNINNGAAIGTGALTIAGSTTINNTSGSAITLATNNAQLWNGNFTFGGNSGLNMGAGAVTMTQSLTVTNNGSGALTVGPIGQSGGSWQLTKAGPGTLVMSGSNTYTGGTTISAGTLQLGNGGTAGSLPVGSAIVDNGTLAFNRGNNVAQGTDFSSAAITGTGGVAQLGAGTLTLAGSNSYSGGTIVNHGTLLLTGSLNPSGALGLGGGSFVYAHAPASAQAVNGLTVYTGASTVNNTSAGTLALGPISRNAGGTVDFPAAMGTITTTATNTNGILGPWAFVGAGASTLYAYSNSGTIVSYTGATAESGSGVFGGIPAGDTSTVNYNVASSGTFAAISSSASVNTITYSGSGASQPAASNISLTINGLMNTGTGPLTVGGSPRLDITIGSSQDLVVATMTGGVVINNNISDNAGGASALTKVGSGLLTLSGTNSYTGTTTIAAGTLQLGSGGATGTLATGGSIIDNGTLAFSRSNNVTQGVDFSAVPISGGGGIVKLGAGNLTLNGLNTCTGTTTVSAGTLTLAAGGPIGTLRGPMTINPGALVNLTATDALGYGGGTSVTMVSISGAALNNAVNGNNSYVTSYVLTGGSMTSSGGGSYNFSTGYGVTTNASAATSVISAPLTVRDQNSLTFNIAVGSTPSGVDLLVSGAIAGDPYSSNALNAITKTGAGRMLLASSASYTGNTAVTGGTLQLANGANILPVTTNLQLDTGGVLDLGGLNQQVVSLADYQVGSHGTILSSSSAGMSVLTVGPGSGVTATFSGQISGGGSLGTINLAMSGAGTQLLAGSNTYSGSTTISAGTLQLGNGGATGSLAAGNAILDNGTLAFGRSNTVTQGVDFSAAAITGAGGLAQLGTGNLILNQANAYSGGTTIAAGTLQVGAGNNSGALGTGSVVNTSVLVFDRSDSCTVNNAISGDGGLYQIGNGTLTLAGNNSNIGPLTVTNSGAIYITASTVTGGVVTVGANPGDFAALNVLSGGTLSAIVSDYVGTNNGNFFVGAGGRGAMTVAGSGIATTASMYAGYNGGASGAYTQTGGLLVAYATANDSSDGVGVVVGSHAGSAGTLNISGGTITGAGPLQVWSGAGSITVSQTGSTPTLVNPSWITLGQNSGAVGTFTQNGGAVLTQSNNLYLGYGGGAQGNYYLHGGSLRTSDLRTDYGTGKMYQDGGSAAVNGSLRVGIYSGANSTYTLAGGTLAVNGGSASVGENGTGTLTIGGSNGGTMVVSSTTSLTIANGSGTGTLNLQPGGLLQTPGVAAGSGKAAFNFSGGTLQNTPSGNLSVTMPVNLSGSGTVAVDAGQTAAFGTSAVLSGTGGFIKSGAGTMVVQSTGTYTGPTVISGGVLQLASQMPQLAYTFTTGSAVNTGSNSTTVTTTPVGSPVFRSNGGPNGLGEMTLNGSNYLAISASSLPNFGGDANYTIAMWIDTTEAGASVLYKGTTGAWSSGDEIFYLTSGTPNSNSGGTGPHVGGVQWGGGFVGGNTAVNTGTWQFISIVRSGGASTVYVNGVNDGTTTIGMVNPEQGTQIIALGYNDGDTGDGALMYSGSISGTYVYGTALAQAQIQTLMNSGPAAVGALPATTALSITGSGAALDLDGTRQAISSLSGVPGACIYLGGGTLTVGSSGSTTFAGSISDSGGVSSRVGGELTLGGNGKLVLAGSNSYSGPTIVAGGTLQLGDGAANGSIDNTSALSIAARTAVNYDLAASDTASYRIIGIGSLSVTGGTLTLSGTNTYTGGTFVEGDGELILAGPSSLESGSNLYVGTDISAFAPIVSQAVTLAATSAAVSPVPEPGTLLLLIAGAALIVMYRKRRWCSNCDRTGFGR